jgi:hypothetical protein
MPRLLPPLPLVVFMSGRLLFTAVVADTFCYV